jgi:hypothetical protein
VGTQKRRNPIRWLLNSFRAQLALCVLVVIGLLAWLAPRRVEQIVTVGEHEAWRASGDLSIREIVWQTPTLIAKLHADESAQFVTPHLTDNGATLYFSRRVNNDRTDIFVTRLVDAQWQDPTAVAVLNSAADDLGPVVSTDGSELYFYSNRSGGIGGADLYVSRRTASGWSEPDRKSTRLNSSH